MQPSPRAETARLLLPSLRFCITSPLQMGERAIVHAKYAKRYRLGPDGRPLGSYRRTRFAGGHVRISCRRHSRKHDWQCVGGEESVSSEHLVGCCERLPLAFLVAAEVPAQHHRRRCHPEPSEGRRALALLKCGERATRKEQTRFTAASGRARARMAKRLATTIALTKSSVGP